MIRKIFFTEGLLIGITGLLAGILLGSLIVWMQCRFGLVTIQDGQAYPVNYQLGDLGLISATVLVIAAIAAWIPLRRMQTTDTFA
jgi:lipoprotein-releasing system permease protein